MKTIILYATKHGAAAEIAKRIAAQFDDADVYDLKQGNIPLLDDFERVIIGSSVYAGTFRKEAKTYLAVKADELCEKKLGLFISGMSESESDSMFTSNAPPEVVKAAVVKDILGGIYDPEKSNFFERFIMKIITKQSGRIDKINDDKINRFVEAMKA